MSQLVECVPNFSEGINQDVIRQIAASIRSVKGVHLLNVDPGLAANRTVMTFAGSPDAVVEAAFLAIKMAGELIDMRVQKGEHPRMGATDVCPLIPLSNISLEETAMYAARLAKRVGVELGIPVYLYEHAQPDKSRSNLSLIRAGEYEGFFDKIKQPSWLPDFGPAEMDPIRGATVIGARDFLIAYNINLNTDDARIAAAIAAEVRESGKKIKQADGTTVTLPGTLKCVKAIGWYIKEYGAAQVSMNLTDINVTPIHLVYEEVASAAIRHGVMVTGSELIGLIPLAAMIGAGKYFSKEEEKKQPLGDDKLIAKAIKKMGLDAIAPFDPDKRIIEMVLQTHL